MPTTLRLPDGKVLELPDGLTPEQAQGYYDQAVKLAAPPPAPAAKAPSPVQQLKQEHAADRDYAKTLGSSPYFQPLGAPSLLTGLDKMSGGKWTKAFDDLIAGLGAWANGPSVATSKQGLKDRKEATDAMASGASSLGRLGAVQAVDALLPMSKVSKGVRAAQMGLDALLGNDNVLGSLAGNAAVIGAGKKLAPLAVRHPGIAQFLQGGAGQAAMNAGSATGARLGTDEQVGMGQNLAAGGMNALAALLTGFYRAPMQTPPLDSRRLDGWLKAETGRQLPAEFTKAPAKHAPVQFSPLDGPRQIRMNPDGTVALDAAPSMQDVVSELGRLAGTAGKEVKDAALGAQPIFASAAKRPATTAAAAKQPATAAPTPPPPTPPPDDPDDKELDELARSLAGKPFAKLSAAEQEAIRNTAAGIRGGKATPPTPATVDAPATPYTPWERAQELPGLAKRLNQQMANRITGKVRRNGPEGKGWKTPEEADAYHGALKGVRDTLGEVSDYHALVDAARQIKPDEFELMAEFAAKRAHDGPTKASAYWKEGRAADWAKLQSTYEDVAARLGMMPEEAEDLGYALAQIRAKAAGEGSWQKVAHSRAKQVTLESALEFLEDLTDHPSAAQRATPGPAPATPKPSQPAPAAKGDAPPTPAPPGKPVTFGFTEPAKQKFFGEEPKPPKEPVFGKPVWKGKTDTAAPAAPQPDIKPASGDEIAANVDPETWRRFVGGSHAARTGEPLRAPEPKPSLIREPAKSPARPRVDRVAAKLQELDRIIENPRTSPGARRAAQLERDVFSGQASIGGVASGEPSPNRAPWTGAQQQAWQSQQAAEHAASVKDAAAAKLIEFLKGRYDTGRQTFTKGTKQAMVEWLQDPHNRTVVDKATGGKTETLLAHLNKLEDTWTRFGDSTKRKTDSTIRLGVPVAHRIRAFVDALNPVRVRKLHAMNPNTSAANTMRTLADNPDMPAPYVAAAMQALMGGQ
jgi:hypothetical protein